MPKKYSLPKVNLRAQFAPASANKEARTVELVWSRGARVLRNDWFEGKFYEELSLEPGAVRMERLNSGAPFLDAHRAGKMADQIGVVERAWIEGGEGKAIIRFARDPESDKIFQNVADGIYRNVSVGYATHRFEQVEGGDEEIPVFRAVDWEPHEISLVPIGADAGAGIRAPDQTEEFECEFVTRNFQPKGKQMDEKQLKEMQDKLAAAEKRALEAEGASKQAIEAAQSAHKRGVEILSLARKHNLDSKFTEELIADEKISLDAARSKILDELATRAPQIDNRNPAITITKDEKETMARGMEGFLLHRANPDKYKLEGAAQEFAGMNLRELARECLEKSGVKTRGLSVHKIAELAFQRTGGMHTTSDFPGILANVANKFLRDGYEEMPATYAPLVREVEVSDFKEISRNQLGDYPKLEKVNEHGEFKRGTISEAAEKYKVETYGKIVAVTRQVIVNDDMAAFTRLPLAAGIRARELVADLVWGIILANANMADGNALFSAAHGNVATSAAAIKDGLSDMRARMKKQVGLDGSRITVMPRYLLVGVERETEAEQVVSGLIVPQTAADVNQFARGLSIISEPRLGAVPYYLAAAVGAIDIIELAYLQGQKGVYLETKMGFDVDGMELKARLDVGAKAIDWRGLQRNAGT